MSEILSNPPAKRQGVKRGKKLSTRIDLTPMVDLGFLLITFFVFTTTEHRPTVMKLVMPAGGNGTVTAAGKTISLLIAGNNEIYYYNGDSLHNMYRTDFSSAGLRSVISSKRAIVENNYGHAAEMVVLIKPTGQSSYRNIVDVLDEMLINQVSRYVLMDADESEIALIGKN